MSQLRKVSRQKAKIRLGLSAVSGGGKTFSALLIAYGLVGDWSKIALIDTESGSADLYEHLGDYNVLPISAPFTPEKYIAAIKECESTPGIEVVIVDSISHEWEGKGGCLDIYEQLGGKWANWANVTPRHQAFIQAILQSKCHVITTVRQKQDYAMEKDSNGRAKVEKVGMKQNTREGFEYELTLNLDLDIRHNATATKDRTGLFMNKPEFVPSEETGKLIAAWCEQGIEATPPAQYFDQYAFSYSPMDLMTYHQSMIATASLEQLATMYKFNTAVIEANPTIKAAMSARKKELSPAPAQPQQAPAPPVQAAPPPPMQAAPPAPATGFGASAQQALPWDQQPQPQQAFAPAPVPEPQPQQTGFAPAQPAPPQTAPAQVPAAAPTQSPNALPQYEPNQPGPYPLTDQQLQQVMVQMRTDPMRWGAALQQYALTDKQKASLADYAAFIRDADVLTKKTCQNAEEVFVILEKCWSEIQFNNLWQSNYQLIKGNPGLLQEWQKKLNNSIDNGRNKIAA